jgi:cephalosporin hydroxylase
MVIEDSNHGVGEVSANLRAYGDLVTPGQFFVVQDTKIDRIAKAGPAATVRAFLAEDSIDRRGRPRVLRLLAAQRRLPM